MKNLMELEIVKITTLEDEEDFESVYEQYEAISARETGSGLKVYYIVGEYPDGITVNGSSYKQKEMTVNYPCKGFKYLENCIYRLNLGIEPCWFDEFQNCTPAFRNEILHRYQEGDYIVNNNRVDNSECQFNLYDNYTYWYAKTLPQYRFLTGDSFTTDEDRGILNLLRLFIINKQFISFNIIVKLSHYRASAYDVYTIFEVCEHNFDFFNILYNKTSLYRMVGLLSHCDPKDQLAFLLNASFKKISTLEWFFQSCCPELNGIVYSKEKLDALFKYATYRWVMNLYEHEGEIVTSYEQWNRNYEARLRTKEKTHLEKLFLKNFGRIPGICSNIQAVCEHIVEYDAWGKDVWDKMVERFDVKMCKKLLKCYSPETTAKILYYDKRFVNVTLEKGIVSKLFDNYSKEKANWIYKNQKVNIDLINEVISGHHIYDLTQDLNNIKQQVKMHEALTEAQRFELKYNFNINKDYECLITQNEIWHNTQHAFLVEDERIVMLGKYTSCCQRMGEAGETAMAYGIIAPNAGFWVIEERNHIIAQAEIWLGQLNGKEVLVFDNIETANCRQLSKIVGTLKQWCQESLYPNIIMGIGYNDICDFSDFKMASGTLVQPKCISVPYPYTDTENGCVWLKRNGHLSF